MLAKHRKKILLVFLILMIPIFLPLFITIIQILFSLGQYFGSIARTVSSI